MAGGGMKDIKRRIKSVESTMQITKAMELVASSKLKKAKVKAEQSKPYFNILYETIQGILANTKVTDSLYTREKEIKRSLFIVIAGDRGLAGGYNSNLFKHVTALMQGKNPILITVGRRTQDYFSKRGYEISASHSNVGETMSFYNAADIVRDVMERYNKGEADEVYVCYTEFVSTLSQVPRHIRLLPMVQDENYENKRSADILYEPSEESVFDTLVPKYLEGIIFSTIVDSYAAEQGARRTAMESATDNASEMIDDLELLYNRARQAAITQEISEIVGGAEALQ